MIDAAGLEQIRWLLLAGGIIAIHSATKPRMTRSSVPPPVTAVHGRRQHLAAGQDGRGRGAARERSPPATAPRSDRRREATLTAGGKRLRPILVLMAAGRAAGEAAVHAATAVELVHMATLVHDDVLDGAPVRRGRPTVVATVRPRPGGRRRRPALLPRLRRAGCWTEARREVDRAQLGVGRAGARGARPAPGRLRHLDLGGALPGALLAEDRASVRVAPAASGAWPRESPVRRRSRTFGRGDRARLPAARRRARRHRAAGADRQGARHRPARRDRDAAADPGSPSSTPVSSGRAARARSDRQPRRSATGSPRPGRWTRCGRGPSGGIRRAKGVLESDDFSDEERQLLAMIADGVVERYA